MIVLQTGIYSDPAYLSRYNKWATGWMIEKPGFGSRLGEEAFLSSIAPTDHDWFQGPLGSYETGTGGSFSGIKAAGPRI
jgi:hypothetical protein